MKCSYSFMENLCLKDVLGMYTVLRQALHRGHYSSVTDTIFYVFLWLEPGTHVAGQSWILLPLVDETG